MASIPSVVTELRMLYNLEKYQTSSLVTRKRKSTKGWRVV